MNANQTKAGEPGNRPILPHKIKVDAMLRLGFKIGGSTSDHSALAEIRRDYEAKGNEVDFTQGMDEVIYWFRPAKKFPFNGLHILDATFEFCACGSDACTCQKCGQRVCGTESSWVEGNSPAHGNVCIRCIAKAGGAK